MIGIEAWRMSIGSHNNKKLSCTSTVTHNQTNGGILLSLMLTLTVMSSVLIDILLVMGGIESNPGPTSGKQNKNQQILLSNTIL